MFLSRFVPVAVVIGTIGCGGTLDILRLDATLRPQTHPDSIQLLAEEPEQPYRVIALVTATEGGFTPKSARERLLEAAARLGGDAVLLGIGSLTRVGTGGESGGTTLQISGKVIVFEREAVRTN